MLTSTDKYRVLFFIQGMRPTDAQVVEGRSYGPHVGYRNVVALDLAGSLEKCDAVAGDVPPRYAAVYPRAVPISEFYARLTKAPGEAAGGPSAPAVVQGADPFARPATPERRGMVTPPAGPPANWNPQG